VFSHLAELLASQRQRGLVSISQFLQDHPEDLVGHARQPILLRNSMWVVASLVKHWGKTTKFGHHLSWIDEQLQLLLLSLQALNLADCFADVSDNPDEAVQSQSRSFMLD